MNVNAKSTAKPRADKNAPTKPTPTGQSSRRPDELDHDPELEPWYE